MISPGPSQFETGSASLSKRLVFATLRPHALDHDDEDVEIDFVAASAADCLAAYRTIAERSGNVMPGLSDGNAKTLQSPIDDYRERADPVGEMGGCRVQPGDKASADADRAESRTRTGLERNPGASASVGGRQIPMTPTMFPPEAQVYVEGPLVIIRFDCPPSRVLPFFCSHFACMGLEIRSSRARNTDT